MENIEERKQAESVLFWMMQDENKALNSTDFFSPDFSTPFFVAYITWFGLKCLRAIRESWVSHIKITRNVHTVSIIPGSGSQDPASLEFNNQNTHTFFI